MFPQTPSKPDRSSGKHRAGVRVGRGYKLQSGPPVAGRPLDSDLPIDIGPMGSMGWDPIYIRWDPIDIGMQDPGFSDKLRNSNARTFHRAECPGFVLYCPLNAKGEPITQGSTHIHKHCRFYCQSVRWNLRTICSSMGNTTCVRLRMHNRLRTCPHRFNFHIHSTVQNSESTVAIMSDYEAKDVISKRYACSRL